MVIDHIRNRALYYGMGEDVKAALDFFATYHNDNPTTADLPLPGTSIIIRVRPTVTEPVEKRPFECHFHHTDIHFNAGDTPEGIGYVDVRNLKIVSRDEEADAALLEGKGDVLTLPKDYFMITLPDDAHQPCVAIGEPSKIHKLIAKLEVK